MHPIAFTRRFLILAVSSVVVVGMATAGFASAAGVFSRPAAPTSAAHYTVLVGNGQHDDFVNTEYTPTLLNIYAGDTVTFKDANRVEPHTVTFGPKKTIAKLAKNFVTPIPHKNGPPTISLTSRVVRPTKSHVYAGGFANSGVLSAEYRPISHTSWTVRFTKPGRYEYWCVIHYPAMKGWIVVHPRPGTTSTYHVQAGTFEPGRAVADTFFPENLTIHVGDTVVWTSFFHTVTFAPAKTIQGLRHHLVLTSKGKNGKRHYFFNPAVVFPSSRNGCGSTTPCMYSGGFLNAGLLQGGPKGPAVFRVTFTKAGKFHYGCLIHPGMDGSITVLPASMRHA